VYECFNGIIPEGKVIDHIDNVKINNNIENLQCVTHQENCKKSAANRDYSFVKDNHKNRKSVQSTCIETGEKDYFPSMYKAHLELGINAGLIKMCCEGLNSVKSAKSKITGKSYKFEYDAIGNN
jgi:hypothetical protein